MATGGSKSILELSFDRLNEITANFSHQIGEDQFGILYKGIMEDGMEIAVKKLKESEQLPTEKRFKKEVQNMMELKHENIVQLIGFCSEEQNKLVEFNGRYIDVDTTASLLCYEYFPKGTLDHYLFAEDSSSAEHGINWDERFKIVKGICQGLYFLHNLAVIHLDLKPENIWLDENMVPKIGNFGLSRLFGQEQTRMKTQAVVGSYGYMAPEYLYTGEISARTDIYSLGLIIIEITTGVKNSPAIDQPSARQYIDKIRKHWTPEHIASEYPLYDAERLQEVYACIKVGLECLQLDSEKRPRIGEIVDRLNGT